MNPEIEERFEICRRVIDRGLSHSVPMNTDSGCGTCVDLFNHLSHELALLRLAVIAGPADTPDERR